MAGKRYSAGAIFLQVVPVFANVQRQIEDYAEGMDRALGDRMEKSGEKAGRRAGKAAGKGITDELKKSSEDYAGHFETQVKNMVRSAEREIGRLDLSTASDKMLKDLDLAKKKLRELKDTDFAIDFDAKKVIADVTAVRQAVEAITKGEHELNIDANLRKVMKDAARIEEIYDKATRDRTIEVEVDTKPAERQMTSFEKSFKKVASRAAEHLSGSMNKEARKLRDELKYLENLRIGVDISANQARRELREISADLERLQRDEVDIDVRVDTGRAFGELAAFELLAEKMERDDIDIDVDVDTRRARRALGFLSRSGDDAANSFRSFNIILLAVAGAGPALIPVLAGIAGGLLAIGPAAAVAGAGLTSVLIGFSGIGDALTALQQRQDAAAQTAQSSAKAQASGARAIEDAQRRLADARRNAARAAEDAAERVVEAREDAAEAVEDALERQKEAQEAYRDSIEEVREAEEALREARREARGTGRDLEMQIAENELAIDQALLDSFNATVNFNAVMDDGSATNAEKEQARIDREEALLRLKELRRERRELAREKKKWDEEGVNGTEAVQQAQENLNNAIEAQRDAYEDLRDAAEAVDEARREGAERVREAIEDQNETLADNRRAIEDAQQALADAHRSAAEGAEELSAQQANVDAAFDKLGPAGKRFARFLFSLREEFYKFRDDVQAVLLPAVESAMRSFFDSPSANVLRDAMIGLADGFGRFVQALSQSFQGEAWLGFFRVLRDLGPDIQKAYGDAFIAFLEGMASVLTTLSPFALEFAEGFARIMQAFADWAASKEGSELFTRFLDYVREIGPKVLEFFKVLTGAVLNILVALAPYGEVVLNLLNALLDYIANLDPKILGAILSTILVLITASQIAYAVMNLFLAGAALIGSTVGVVVFLLVGLGLAIAYLYQTNEDFRDFIKKAWGEISDAFQEAWKDHIKPALMDLWDALKVLWHEVLVPLFKWLGPIILWAAKKIIPLLAMSFSAGIRWIAFMVRDVFVPVVTGMARAVEWLWKQVLKPTWNAIATAAKWLWREVLAPTWDNMKQTWTGLMDGMRWAWNHILKPVFDFIKDKALPKLAGAFDDAVDAIKKIWDGLKKVVGAPIKFVLDTIINDGLIDGFNKVAGWVGMKGFKHIPIPNWLQSYASGGVMPGYTPGRDVHRFVSPTGGRLELSGGEAVMRPEWTAAVGPSFVHSMNALARRGGVNAVRKAMMGGYWMGGILPLPGALVSPHGSGYSGYAADMNYPGYSDYGKPVKAWKPGIVAQMNYIGDASYGRWVVLNHGAAQSSLYAHLSNFGPIKVGQSVGAGATIGYVGDIGNTGTPPTSHLHFEIKGGAVDYSDSSFLDRGGKSGGKQRPRIPGWVKSIVSDPLGAVKDWITAPVKKASDAVKDSPVFDAVTKLPLRAAKAVTDKVWDVVPGWVKTAVGWAGDGAEWVVGGVKNAPTAASDAAVGLLGHGAQAAGAVADFLGFVDGGVLPYNGTMKYDDGGYLPPGLTSVVNLTGRPEPVFTADQWEDMEPGTAGIHYEPHFEGSDLTADDVAQDLNFAFRKLRRSGKYGRIGS